MTAYEQGGMAIERATAEMNRTTVSQLSKVMGASDRSFNTALSKRTTFLSRLFPTRVERVAREGEVRVLEVEFDFFAQTVAAVRSMQLDNFRELANAGRVRTVGGLRKGTVAYLSQQWEELRDELSRRFEDLAAKLEKEAEKAESMSNPVIKDVARDRIKTQILAFAEYIDRELQSFLELSERAS
jgi:recombinational DNA repair ATPase RecF